jgi:acyl-coenzyme A synthetase/AMP-(fatty) acid ligase
MNSTFCALRQAARRHTPLLCKARAQMSALCEFARANLVHFKAPHSVTFVKELPKIATGKIQKYILRAQQPVIAPP